MCQDNESIPVSGCLDLKTGPDHGWNPNGSLILLDELILVHEEKAQFFESNGHIEEDA